HASPIHQSLLVKKDFIGQGPYPTYIFPSSSETTPPPSTNPFWQRRTSLAKDYTLLTFSHLPLRLCLPHPPIPSRPH
ncbi:hypothetical protein AZE42_12182, partial [Rhizopogon vesiculosus]